MHEERRCRYAALLDHHQTDRSNANQLYSSQSPAHLNYKPCLSKNKNLLMAKQILSIKHTQTAD
jgi:hypothetical protein